MPKKNVTADESAVQEKAVAVEEPVTAEAAEKLTASGLNFITL